MTGSKHYLHLEVSPTLHEFLKQGIQEATEALSKIEGHKPELVAELEALMKCINANSSADVGRGDMLPGLWWTNYYPGNVYVLVRMRSMRRVAETTQREAEVNGIFPTFEHALTHLYGSHFNSNPLYKQAKQAAANRDNGWAGSYVGSAGDDHFFISRVGGRIGLTSVMYGK